jgi:branched-chain amino acid transport system substrate-binding protein
MKKITSILLVAIVILGGYFLLNKNKTLQVSEPIKVGIIESLTGSAAYYGQENKNGVEIAMAEIATKYPDLKFEVYHEDSLYTPKGGVDAYNALKARYKLDAVITHASHVSLAIQPLAKADGILQMGVSASAKNFTSPNDVSFRVSPTIETEVEIMADYIKEKGYKKVSVMYFNTDVGINILDAIKVELAGSGSQVSTEDAFALDATDFRTYLAKVKQAQSDAIYAIGTAAHLSNILKQANELGIKVQFLGFRAAEDPTLTKNAGVLAEGFVYTYAFDSEDNRKETKDFVGAYKAKYNSVPDGYAAEGYEGMMLTAAAFDKCGKDYPCIQSYLSGLKNYKSIFGDLSFDQNGDVTYPFFLKVVRDGKFVRLTK